MSYKLGQKIIVVKRIQSSYDEAHSRPELGDTGTIEILYDWGTLENPIYCIKLDESFTDKGRYAYVLAFKSELTLLSEYEFEENVFKNGLHNWLSYDRV